MDTAIPIHSCQFDCKRWRSLVELSHFPCYVGLIYCSFTYLEKLFSVSVVVSFECEVQNLMVSIFKYMHVVDTNRLVKDVQQEKRRSYPHLVLSTSVFFFCYTLFWGTLLAPTRGNSSKAFKTNQMHDINQNLTLKNMEKNLPESSCGNQRLHSLRVP